MNEPWRSSHSSLKARAPATLAPVSLRDNRTQRFLPHTDLDRRRTNVLAVCEDLCHRLRREAHPRRPKILNLFHADVPAAIDHAKEPQQPQLIQRPHKAEVEQTIVHLRLVR